MRFNEWSAQGIVEQIGPTRRGNGTRIMLLVDANGIPLSIDTVSANIFEVRLIEPLVENRHRPGRLIYDKATDSNRLRDQMRHQGIDFLCPTRENRK